MSTTDIKFEFSGFTFPRIDSLFLSAPNPNSIKVSYRADALILDDNTLKLLFGIQLRSEEVLENKRPKVQCTVEMLGDFVFKDVKLGEYKRIDEIPLISNMLAILYPFLREKVYYCMSANQFPFILHSVNVHEMVKANAGNMSFQVTDLRKQPKELVP